MVDGAIYQSVLDALDAEERVVFSVTTASMWPVLQPGDRVTVVPCAASLQIGDLVCIADDDVFVVHRFLGTFMRSGQAYAKTCGDRMRRLDKSLPVEKLVGCIESYTRNGRVIRSFTVWRKWENRVRGYYALMTVYLFGGLRILRNRWLACTHVAFPLLSHENN